MVGLEWRCDLTPWRRTRRRRSGARNQKCAASIAGNLDSVQKCKIGKIENFTISVYEPKLKRQLLSLWAPSHPPRTTPRLSLVFLCCFCARDGASVSRLPPWQIMRCPPPLPFFFKCHDAIMPWAQLTSTHHKHVFPSFCSAELPFRSQWAHCASLRFLAILWPEPLVFLSLVWSCYLSPLFLRERSIKAVELKEFRHF